MLINSRKNSQTNRMYSSEQELVDHFISSIDHQLSPWGIAGVNTEFNYARGKTDIVIIDRNGAVIAIEAKLDKWKYAIHQAYRNLCFANQSYVLLPTESYQIACFM